jgi:hypothetical protein
MPRPPFTPTQEQRGIVKSMAAVGIAHEDIALLPPFCRVHKKGPQSAN